MTLEGWARVVKLWSDVWPERPLPSSSVETWFELLRDVDDDAALAAIATWARDPDRSWPPLSPGELRAVADPDEGDWVAALGELTRQVRSEGAYGRPDLSESLATYVASMGGWRALCARWDPTDPATRAQFRDHFQTVRRRARRDRAAALPRGILPALSQGEADA